MNNDLISREALKKAFEDTVCIEPMPYAFVKQIIDNAPTVEYTFEEAFQKTVCENKLYCPERQKGKWIFHKDYNERKYGCNQCGNLNNIPSKFCPNCGTKMDKVAGGMDCMDEDAKQASIPYTYDAPKHDWKCGYPDITRGEE